MVAPQASCLSCLHLLGHPIPGVTRCAQPPSLPWLLPGAWFCCLQLYFDRLPDSFPNHSFSWSSILRCSYCRFPAIPPLPFWNLCHPQADEKFLKKKTAVQDFPGGPVVQNLPCNAGNVGSISGWGTKIPHTVGATKPMCQNYRTCTLQQKIPLVRTKTQCGQINT